MTAERAVERFHRIRLEPIPLVPSQEVLPATLEPVVQQAEHRHLQRRVRNLQLRGVITWEDLNFQTRRLKMSSLRQKEYFQDPKNQDLLEALSEYRSSRRTSLYKETKEERAKRREAKAAPTVLPDRLRTPVPFFARFALTAVRAAAIGFAIANPSPVRAESSPAQKLPDAIRFEQTLPQQVGEVPTLTEFRSWTNRSGLSASTERNNLFNNLVFGRDIRNPQYSPGVALDLMLLGNLVENYGVSPRDLDARTWQKIVGNYIDRANAGQPGETARRLAVEDELTGYMLGDVTNQEIRRALQSLASEAGRLDTEILREGVRIAKPLQDIGLPVTSENIVRAYGAFTYDVRLMKEGKRLPVSTEALLERAVAELYTSLRGS